MNFLLFSAKGIAGKSPLKMSAAAGLWAQTWGRLSVSCHIPISSGDLV